MPVSLAFRLTALAAACVALSACSSFDAATGRVAGLVSPYKVEVVQGNFVSKEQKDALQLGMPRAQVRDILGSPLVTSVFHADRWEYVFTIRRQGQEPQQRKLTVFFRGDELSKVESDEMISEDQFVASLSVGRRLEKVPLLEVPPEVLREFGLQSAARAPLIAPTSSASATAPATRYPPLEAPGALTSAWDASTQRAVAASAATRATAVTVPAAPLLAPLASPPPPAAATPAPAPLPATARTSAPAVSATPVPAPAVVAAPVAVAPAPVAQASPAPAPVPSVAAVAAPPTPAPVTSPPRVAAPAPIATPTPTPTPTPAPVNVNPAPQPVAPAASRPATTDARATQSPPSATTVAPAAPVSARVDAPVSRQAAPSPVAAPPAASPVPLVASAPPSAMSRAPSANTLATADPEITSFLNRWSSDWQSRNATSYFTHYLPEFKGSSATRAEWEALRRSRIEGRTRISVGLFDVRVRMVTPTEARLVFRQVYESDAFNEVGTKAMFLVKRDGRWLIEREFFTPAQ